MFKIIHKWKDNLIWCPSQYSFLFEYNSIRYKIYLKWRWDDPWTLDIIKYVENKDKQWNRIYNFPYFKQEDNLDVIKKHAFIETIKFLKNNKK